MKQFGFIILPLAGAIDSCVASPARDRLGLLAPEVLPTSKAKSWLAALKAAEKARKAKRQEAKIDAAAEKTTPRCHFFLSQIERALAGEDIFKTKKAKVEKVR